MPPTVLIREVTYRGETLDLLVDGNRVVPATGDISSDVRVIEAKGLVAIPGLIDKHVHFRDPGLTEKEDLLTGARAAAAGGYCAVHCEPNTRPVIDSVDAVNAFRQRVRDLGIPIIVETKSALTLGQRGEELTDIEALEPLVPAFSDDGEPLVDRAILAEAFSRVRGEITAHCEETPRSSARVRAALGDGPELAREPEIIAMHLEVLEKHPARLHLQHVSMAESARMIAHAKNCTWGKALSAEVTPHHLLLCDEDIPSSDANWKMNPPLRNRADMMAMRKALADGVIDVIATDHAPHTPAEKSVAWEEAPFGIIGLETAFGACMKLVHAGELSFERLVSAMAGNTDLFSSGIHGVTLVDMKKEWIVEPDIFYSKARNCPFAGMTFVGKVTHTIVDGMVVMADGHVLF